MLKRIREILSLILVLLFFMAGTGLNVVHYCCEGCREAGVEHIAEHKCTAIHSHYSGHCCHKHQHHGTCWFKHLNVDLGGISASLTCPKMGQHQIFTQEACEISPCDIRVSIHGQHARGAPPERVVGTHPSQRVSEVNCVWLI